MFGTTATMILQIALLATGRGEYQEAFERADESDHPFLVLVGADWCPGCRAMKQETMPKLSRSGKLEEIVYTEVNAETQSKLSRKLLKGRSIPQLVLYTRAGKLWRRVHLTGVHSPQQVQEFLEREIAAGREIDKERRDQQQSAEGTSQLTNAEKP